MTRTRPPSPRGSRPLRAVAAIAVASMLVVACGQKPGVHIEGAGEVLAGPEAGAGTTTGTETPTTGDPGDTTGPATTGTTGFSTGSSQTTQRGTTGGTTTGTTGGTTGGTSGGTSGGATGATTGDATTGGTGETTGGTTDGGGQVQGTDRTGVTDELIRIGIHAPVTGAAPLPSRAFERAQLYFDYVTKVQEQTVLGRPTVEVLFKDDQYNPSSAIQTCRELAQSRESFLLVGGGGTDQIQACGRWANQNGVPYFSAGVTENGLIGLPWYFASSMSYKAQGTLIAQLIKKRYPGQKIAMVVTNTPNFKDAEEGFTAGLQAAGIEGDFWGFFRHEKGDNTWTTQAIVQMREEVDVVYPLTAPVDYIKFAGEAANQGWRPNFVGAGITMGLNTVTVNACRAGRAGHGALWLSPFPGLDVIDQLDPEFSKALEAFGYQNDAVTDKDIYLAIWGLGKTLHESFKAYEARVGTDLTREDYRAVIETTPDLQSGIYPALSYSPDDHFGADTAHLLKADCDADSNGMNVTEATFASAF